MNNPGFRPNRGRYLILPNPVESQTTKIEGSQYTIESQKDIHAKPSEGKVVAKGAECTEYEPGAIVLYGKFSGYEQLFDGVNYLILAETEILGERLVTPFDDELIDLSKVSSKLLAPGQIPPRPSPPTKESRNRHGTC